jgi:hypothetical protein
VNAAPIQAGPRSSPCTTSSGTTVLRTPNRLKPVAKLPASAAWYAGLASALARVVRSSTTGAAPSPSFGFGGGFGSSVPAAIIASSSVPA